MNWGPRWPRLTAIFNLAHSSSHIHLVPVTTVVSHKHVRLSIYVKLVYGTSNENSHLY